MTNLNSNLAENFEQESFDTIQESDSFQKSIMEVAQDIKTACENLELEEPANDNDPENPKDPNSGNKAKEWLQQWSDLGAKVSECDKMIKEKGLTPAEQEDRFQKAFEVASTFLRYELQIGEVFNNLPSAQGSHNPDKQKYTKYRYIEEVFGIPYKKAWKLAKLTPEAVEKAIEFGGKYKELPTSRLAYLLLCQESIQEAHEKFELMKEQKKAERKAKREAAAEAKLERELADYEAMENQPLSLPAGSTYEIICADPSKCEIELEKLKSLVIPAAENSVLFMWSSASKLKENLDLMEAWGFDYKENAVWDRMDNSHPGKYFANQYDLLLVGTKGEGLAAHTKEKSICRIPLKEGETKPEYYTEILKTLFPGKPCLDVIATINESKEV